MATEPAKVTGSEMRGVAFFIEDWRGDLVDIEYECEDCASVAQHMTALPWPGFDFGASGSYCRNCHAMIDAPRAE